ncbi:MAG: N-(5'-phosphoribosyl)anthranilate isomerase [Pseudomonadota bacterium]
MPAAFARPVLTAEGHLLEIFSSKAACSGGVIRRKARDIDRFIGREAFLNEVHRRGFRAVENAGQIIVFCNSEPVRRLV